MTARAESRCSYCKLPEDVRELIYELIVRQGVKPLPAYNEICEVLKEQGQNPPNQRSFYIHVRKHLDPERSALMTMAKNADRLNESARGFDQTLLAYLVSRWEEEKDNRKSLQNLIKKINHQVDQQGKEALNAGDLAKIGTALANAVKVLQEGNLQSKVLGKVLLDIIAGLSFNMEREVVLGIKKACEVLVIKTKGGDEVRRIMEDTMHEIIANCENISKLAEQQLEKIKEYQA